MKSLQDLRFIPKTPCSPQIPTTHFPNPLPNRITTHKITSLPKTPPSCSPNPRQKCFITPKIASFFSSPATHLRNSPQSQPWSLRFGLLALLSAPFPSLAAETEQISDKINLESIVISIDDFFNRNPFFVAGVSFVWLIAIPLTQEYLKKYKAISAIDAFRKLRDDPSSQLLDIRKKLSVMYMESPNLNALNKNVVQLEFAEGDEEGFVKEVMKSFQDPGNTVICVLDNFDGNSMKVAELLFKNGFKEAYAIKGGLRGKDGWQAIQETLLPPSVHVYPRKTKSLSSTQPEMNSQRIDEQSGSSNGQAPASSSMKQGENPNKENGFVKPTETAPEAKLVPMRSLSPFPNYPDLKPPSSPTPSKPQG